MTDISPPLTLAGTVTKAAAPAGETTAGRGLLASASAAGPAPLMEAALTAIPADTGTVMPSVAAAAWPGKAAASLSVSATAQTGTPAAGQTGDA